MIVIILAHDLCAVFSAQKFHFFLDNLFLNVAMTHCLLQLNILCMGITQKNATDVLKWFIKFKNQNQMLIWDSAFTKMIEKALCFLWQNNNAVLGITTDFSLQQQIFWERKRSTEISTNAQIIRPVFKDAIWKKL